VILSLHLKIHYDLTDKATHWTDDKRDVCKMVLDNAHIGVFVCDPDGIIRYMNQMFAEMFEINKQTAIGRKVTDYFADSVLLQVMKTGVPHKGVIFSWKGRDALVYRTPIKRQGIQPYCQTFYTITSETG
jgi:transcriptional regulator with PAS, ATPase and Fis domain